MFRQDGISCGARNFIIDFSGTEMLDATGLGALFSLYRTISPLNGVVLLANVTPCVQVVIQLTRINRVFPDYSSRQAASRAL